MGLDGSSPNSLGPPGTLWDPFWTLWDPLRGPRESQRRNSSQSSIGKLLGIMARIEKNCILFSSIFKVDRPFQRYLLKTSGPGENNPITKRKNNFFSKFPRCKISTSTFSEIGNKKKINGFGVWSGPFFLTWVHLKGSVKRDAKLAASKALGSWLGGHCCKPGEATSRSHYSRHHLL